MTNQTKTANKSDHQKRKLLTLLVSADDNTICHRPNRNWNRPTLWEEVTIEDAQRLASEIVGWL